MLVTCLAIGILYALVLSPLVILYLIDKQKPRERDADPLIDWGFGMLLKASLDVERAARGGKNTFHENALVQLASVKLFEAQHHRHSHHGLVARAAIREVDRCCREAIKLAAVDTRSIQPMPDFEEAEA